MKNYLIYLILVIYGTTLQAQNKADSTMIRPLNSINLGIFGDASLISASYERLFPVSPNLLLTGKVGLGYNEEFQLCLFGPCTSTADTYVTVPHHVTGILGKRRSFFEFGLGGAVIGGNPEQPYYLYPIIGYRLLPLKADKVTFRIFALVPLSGFETEDVLILPMGLSLGIIFK